MAIRARARSAQAWVSALLWGALCLSCSAPEGQRGRVVLIGIDGATLRLATPMMKEGRLPHLATLAAEGAHGPLRSLLPLSSPRIWNTIATGKTPEKHGITAFAHTTPDGTHQLMLGSDRKSHALWNIASDAGLSVAVINWWNTYPPEKVNGVVVSDHLIASEIQGRKKLTKSVTPTVGPVVYPEEWEPKLKALRAQSKALTRFHDPFADAQLPKYVLPKGRKGMSRRFAEDNDIMRMALEVETELRPDVLLVFLPGIDRISHFLWASVEADEAYPKHLHGDPALKAAGAKALRTYYEYTDALIGRLLERYGSQDLVLVVSDHGFEAGVRMMTLTGVHESKKALDGVLFARGPGIPAGVAAGPVSIKDITPAILTWLGLPLGEDMDGDKPGFLQRDPPARIATYDTKPIQRLTTEASGVEEEIVERLRGLGYLE